MFASLQACHRAATSTATEQLSRRCHTSFSPPSLPAVYFRLDSVLRKRCAADAARLCGVDASLIENPFALDRDPNTVGGDEGISKCLQDHRRARLRGWMSVCLGPACVPGGIAA